MGAISAVSPVLRAVSATRTQRVPGAYQQLDAAIPAWMAKFRVPGLAVAVVQRGQSTWAKGYGVKKAGTSGAVSADTVFEAGSLSKPVFAYLTLLLAEAGALDLDRSIGSWFRMPDFAADATVDAITPRIVARTPLGLLTRFP
jgi:CubicO group peptidase (beta-lactamase class C family)